MGTGVGTGVGTAGAPGWQFSAGESACDTDNSGLVDFPDSLEVHKVAFHFEAGNGVLQAGGGMVQFLFVMAGFGLSVAVEASGEPSVGSAIGMKHQDRQLGSVQADGFADLLDDEFAIRFVFGAGEAFGSAGDFDGVGIENALALEVLRKTELKAVIEAPDDGGVAMVFFARSVGMVDLLHFFLSPGNRIGKASSAVNIQRAL